MSYKPFIQEKYILYNFMFSITKAQLINEQHTTFQAEITFFKILVAQHKIVNLKESVLTVRFFFC